MAGSDNFNAANGTELNGRTASGSGTWTVNNGDGDLEIQSNTAARVSDVAVSRAAEIGGSETDSYAEASVENDLTNNERSGPAVRCQGGVAQTGYQQTAYSTTRTRLWRDLTAIVINNSTTLALGDVLRVEAVGTTITGYINGSSDNSTTDATYASGPVGMTIRGDCRLDDFDGGALGGGGAAVPVFVHSYARRRGF